MPLDLPVPGADAGTWGTKLNNALNGTGPGTLSATYARKAGSNITGPLAILHAALANRRQQPIRVVTVGASTATGVGSSSAWAGFPYVLARVFQRAYPSGNLVEPVCTHVDDIYAAPPTEPGVHVHRRAWSGATSDVYVDAVTRTRIAGLSPAAVIHMIGSNDYATGVPVATFKANVEATIADIRAQMSTPCAHVLIFQQPRLTTDPNIAPWQDYGDALQAIADANPEWGVFIDANQAFGAAGVTTGDPLDLIGTDNLHLTDEGHLMMADLVTDALRIPHSSPLTWDFYDTLARPDGAPGTADSGHVWQTLTGTWAIQSGKLAVTANGTIAAAGGFKNVEMTGWLTVGAGSSSILVRLLDDGTRFGVFLNLTNQTADLYRSIGSVHTAVVSTPVALTTGQRRLVRLVSSDDVISAYVDGVHTGSYTLTASDKTTFANATRIGVRTNVDSGMKWDHVAARRI